MVSFSCENCGDVLTKKKLDAHRSQCRGASFTCLDCMTHFWDTEYKAHTTCISEAQKYQGALYKEKPKRKSVTIAEPPSMPRKAYVEDAPDPEYDGAMAVVSAPPHAPSPPRGAPADPVNVFDFLVNDETPNASRISLPGSSTEQMCMVDHAPPLFKSVSGSPEDGMSQSSQTNNFHSQGYSYGAEPIQGRIQDPYRTPAPKAITYHEIKPRDTKSTDKKRKRQVEDLDLTHTLRASQGLDEEMLDVETHPTPVLHSGLTGGLNRLLSTSKFPPSPDYSGGSGAEPSTISQVKNKQQPAGLTVEKRGRRAGGLIKVRKVRRSSDESRPRKHHRSHRHDRHEERSPNDRKRVVKAIEYHPRSLSPDAHEGNQLIVYRSRAEHFLSFVNKGPESESGCSINKALKRYHRERGEQRLGYGKHEEEKELWKSLRLKRNDRGEVVVMVGNSP